MINIAFTTIVDDAISSINFRMRFQRIQDYDL